MCEAMYRRAMPAEDDDRFEIELDEETRKRLVATMALVAERLAPQMEALAAQVTASITPALEALAASVSAALEPSLAAMSANMSAALSQLDLASLSALAEAALDEREPEDAVGLALPDDADQSTRDAALFLFQCATSGALVAVLATMPRDEAVRAFVLLVASIVFALRRPA